MTADALPRTAAIVVIGGGVMGASLAYHLTRRGCHDVVLLEREPLFGTGATGRCAGGIRHQFASEVNVRLSLLSLPVLDDFEQETGRSALVRKCGYLFALTREEDVAAFRRNVELQRGLGVQTHWLSGDEVRARLPACDFADAVAGTLCEEDGLADPASVVDGYLGSARRHGARCLSGVEVNRIDVRDGRVVRVGTAAGDVETTVVVNAAGPWAAEVGQLVGIDIPVRPVRRQWLTTTPVPGLPEGFPFVIDFAQSLYFHREGPGLLTGMSNTEQPPGCDQTVDDDWELTHLEAAARRLPALQEVGITARTAGLYEVTPDAHPLIGSTSVEGFHLMTGFSGHGFMHAPAAGLLMAELLLDGAAHTLDISALSPTRFAGGGSAAEYNVV